MHSRNLKKIIGLFLLFIGMGVIGNVAFADTTSAFSVSPLDPETNQPQSSYYELQNQAGKKQKLSLRIFNTSDQAIQIKLEANNATTNNNGITSYLKVDKKDPSLKVGFSDLVSYNDDVITISKQDTKDVSVTVNYPDKNFDGVILGGLRVYQVTQEKDKVAKGVTNQVAYTVGVVINGSKTVKPEMNLVSAQPEQRNYRNYISATLQNAAPTIVKKLEVKATVLTKENRKKMYEHQSSEMRMAPNSNFNYGISLENQALKNGTYIMTVEGKADGVPFNFEKEFTIDKKVAKKLNENAIFVENDSNIPVWMIVGAVLLVVLLLLILVYVWKLQKRMKTK